MKSNLDRLREISDNFPAAVPITAAVSLATAFSAGLAIGGYKHEQAQSLSPEQARVAAIDKKYQYRQLGKIAQSSYDELIDAKPLDVIPHTKAEAKNVGLWLQHNLGTVSNALLATGVDHGRVDEYDLEKSLLTPKTQRALTNYGFSFRQIRPHDCVNAEEYGYRVDAYDYTTTAPDQVKVKVSYDTGHGLRTTVPLFGAQKAHTATSNPMDRLVASYMNPYNYANVFDGSFAPTQPCWEEPQVGSMKPDGTPQLKQVY